MNKQQLREYQNTEERFFIDSPNVDSIRMRVILDRLHRYETTLHRISENECNGHPRMKVEYRDGKMYRFEVEDMRWKERDDKKEISIQNKVKAIADELGFVVDFNGDPRGGSIQFTLPSKKSNSWNNEQWGIFW
jgi:hypothetical protein